MDNSINLISYYYLIIKQFNTENLYINKEHILYKKYSFALLPTLKFSQL